MFNYSLRTKVLLSMALVSMLVIVTIIIFDSQKKSRDLLLVSQVKILANSLERYYDKYNAYPDIAKMDVEDIKFISDKGINNSEGKVIYYKKEINVLAGSATIASRADNYSIEFRLNNKWPIWNLDKMSGGKCRITANVVMQCVADR